MKFYIFRKYPFGLSFAEGLDREKQSYKYTGKELDMKQNMQLYDYSARYYDPTIGRFTTVDPLEEKYYSVSPYVYCMNNPVNTIDFNGDSITILNLTDGEHLVILIQNNSGKWQYYSYNGDNVYISGKHIGGRSFNDLPALDKDGNPLQFKTPQQFLDSYYNQSGDKDDKSINSYGFKEGYVLPTTSRQDKIVRFNATVKKGYSLISNQCAIAVQKSLIAAGIEIRNPKTYIVNRQFGDINEVRVNPYLPSQAYKAIIKNNPQGFSIYPNKK